MSGKRKTISLNCSLAVPTPSISTPISGSETPNTPEILNAIINISSDHLESLSKTVQKQPVKKENITNEYDFATTSSSSISELLFKTDANDPYSDPSIYQTKELSPTQNFGNKFVKSYHSQFVKEGLKLKVKQKIKDEMENSNYGSEDGDIKMEGELTYEDAERRNRRRERNKIAATKCRNKKKERTTRLIAEGEVLEIQNASLKEELKKLEVEKRSLSELLSQHHSHCVKKPKLSVTKEAPKTNKIRSHDEFKQKFKMMNNKAGGVSSNTHSPYNANHFEFNNYENSRLDVLGGKNMFIKEEAEACTASTEYYQQNVGHCQYGYYNTNPLKSHYFDAGQSSLYLNNYPWNGGDTRCLAL